MELNFKSKASFCLALKEVDVLIDIAKKYENNRFKYQVFLKSALLLLVTKFENFLEQTANEYIEILNSLNIEPCYIPNKLKVIYSIDKISNCNINTKNENLKNIFTDLGQLWNNSVEIYKLKMNIKFRFGRHGTREIEKLFNKIGIYDIFSQIELRKKVPNINSDNGFEIQKIDLKGAIDSPINIRNTIIHEDATPSLTLVAISETEENFRIIASKISIVLINNLRGIIKK